MSHKNERTSRTTAVGVGLALGASLGTTLGLLIDNVGIGIALGVALGAAFGGYSPLRSGVGPDEGGCGEGDPDEGTGA